MQVSRQAKDNHAKTHATDQAGMFLLGGCLGLLILVTEEIGFW